MSFFRWVLCLCSIISAQSWSFEIVCLNVGQGDSTLIRGDNGKTVLIDAGGISDLNFRQLLLLQGIGKIDEVISTHYDRDHIGNMDEVIRTFSPSVAYDHGGAHETTTFDQYVAAAGDKRQTIQPGQVIDLDGKTILTCIVVDGSLSNGTSVSVQDENDRSIGILVEYGEFEFFISGDLGGGGLGAADVESQVAPIVGDIEVLRINHHGSSTSSNQTFLETLMPELAVISVGGSNPFGHPTQEVLDRIGSIESVEAILQTSEGNAGTHELVRDANGHIRLSVVVNNGIKFVRASSSTAGFSPILIPFSAGLSGDLDGNGKQDAGDLAMLLETSAPDVFSFSLGWHKVGVLPTATPTRTFTPSFTPTPTPTGPTPTFTLPFNTPSPTTPGQTPLPTTGPTAGMTPGTTATPPPASANIRIQSAIPNPSGPDGTGREEIVLVNLSNFQTNLAGYKIKDDDGNSKTLSGTISANGTFTFNPSGNILNNTGDTFLIESPQGKVLHQVSYTEPQAGDGVRIFF